MVDETDTDQAGYGGSSDAVKGQSRAVISVIFLVCAGLGVYFCSLQNTFYSHYQPFFDSLSYFNEVHRVMTTGQQEGVVASLRQASDENSTVFAPKCIAALVSPVFGPSRNFAVWLQLAEVLILLLSLVCYFRIVKQATPWMAMIFVTPFLLTSCLYQSHGGVSDFRMDLSLYLLYSVSCVWYLISIKTGQYVHFMLFGAAIAATCLFRATAPVYIVLSLGPLVVAELFVTKIRADLVKGLCLAAGVAVSGAGWFYVTNFDYLKYYYFVWNTDANAKLSLAEAARHINFAFDHIGIVFLCWLALLNGLLVVAKKNSENQSLASALKATVRKSIEGTDFRLVWLAIAPIGLLVLRGAGLNRYVSMPAAFGLVLYLSSSLSNDRSLFATRATKVSAFAASLVALLLVGFDGWKDHRAGSFNSMAAHKQTIDLIVADAREEGLKRVTLDSSHMYYLHSFSLEATMRFDIPEANFASGDIEIGGIKVLPRPVFSRVVAQADWDELEGSPEERLDQLVSDANEKVDYLILPGLVTANFLEQQVAHNLINKYQNKLRTRLLNSRQWVPIGNTIENSDREILQLYRNQKRVEVAQQKRDFGQRSIVR